MKLEHFLKIEKLIGAQKKALASCMANAERSGGEYFGKTTEELKSQLAEWEEIDNAFNRECL